MEVRRFTAWLAGIFLIVSACSSSDPPFSIDAELERNDDVVFVPEEPLETYPNCFALYDSDGRIGTLSVGSGELHPAVSPCILLGHPEPPTIVVPAELDTGTYQVCADTSQASPTNCMGIRVR